MKVIHLLGQNRRRAQDDWNHFLAAIPEVQQLVAARGGRNLVCQVPDGAGGQIIKRPAHAAVQRQPL